MGPEGLPGVPLAIVSAMSSRTDVFTRRAKAAGGRPTLASIVALDGWNDSTLLAVAASLAAGLEAPVAAAIVDGAREREIRVRPVDRVLHTTRTGAAAAIAGHAVVLGDSTLFGDLGISIDALGDWPERLRRRGEQVLFVAMEGRTAGLLGVVDATPGGETHTHVMEDEMRQSLSTADHFPTDTTGLPEARSAEVVEAADGDRIDLRIAPVRKRLGERAVWLLAYNGSVPGPTLRVRQGSELLVNVINAGDIEATVHWHGLRLENRYDGTLATQPPIPVGGAFTYRLTFPDAGIYWYHPHIREDYGQELGLYGNIVVVPSEADYWPPAHREITLALDDIRLEDGRVAPFSRLHPNYTAMGRFGNVLLVNGEPYLSTRARLGEVVRLYLTNTANTRVFNVGVRGARMKLVGGDSGRCERETFVDHVIVAPSERAVVDVLFGAVGEATLEHRTPHRAYPLATITVEPDRAEPSLAAQFERLRTNADLAGARAGMDAYVAAEPDRTLALVAVMDVGEPQSPGTAVVYVCPMHPGVVADAPGRCPACGMKLLPSTLVRESSHGETHHAHAGAEEHGNPQHGTGSAPAHDLAGIEWEDDMVDVNRLTTPGNMRWQLIDRQTGAEGAAIDWRFRVGERVKIRIVNEMDSDHPMHHPFHVHGAGRFLILSRDGAVEPNLVWKDTVLVPTGQTVDILLDVTHPGVWMAHCHIAEHHESGMMLRFHVDP